MFIYSSVHRQIVYRFSSVAALCRSGSSAEITPKTERKTANEVKKNRRVTELVNVSDHEQAGHMKDVTTVHSADRIIQMNHSYRQYGTTAT